MEIKFKDYRDVEGCYDYIVLIGMLEAVGENNWNSYFNVILKCLKTNRQVMLQTITINESRFDEYCEKLILFRYLFFLAVCCHLRRYLKNKFKNQECLSKKCFHLVVNIQNHWRNGMNSFRIHCLKFQSWVLIHRLKKFVELLPFLLWSLSASLCTST